MENQTLGNGNGENPPITLGATPITLEKAAITLEKEKMPPTLEKAKAAVTLENPSSPQMPNAPQMPNPQPQAMPKIVQGIFKTSEPRHGGVLGPLPQVTSDILTDKDFFLRSRLRKMKKIFFAIVGATAIVGLFFTYELSPRVAGLDLLTPYLGETVAQTRERKEAEALKWKTDAETALRTLINRELDLATYHGEIFLQKMTQMRHSPPDALKNLENELARTHETLTALLVKVKKHFSKIPAEIIGNLERPLRILETMEPDGLTNAEMQTVLQKLFKTLPNPLAQAAQIKERRIMWPEFIREIDIVTGRVDESYSAGFFKEFGGIGYGAYDFNKETGRITLSGVSKQFDARNFSEIADLIDELESSPKFKEVDMRAFSKNGDSKEGYLANFKIDLSIQMEETDPRDRALDVTRLP